MQDKVVIKGGDYKSMFHLPFVLCVSVIYQEVGNLGADIAPTY